MSSPRRLLNREDIFLLISAVVLGLAVASVFGAYRAVSANGEDASGRITEFASSVAFPGGLIFAGVAVAVWFGWKANID